MSPHRRLQRVVAQLEPDETAAGVSKPSKSGYLTSATEFGVESVGEEIALLRKCREELREFIDKTNCNPIMVRLAWHDSGTFDKVSKTGGANGSIRFSPEINHGAN